MIGKECLELRFAFKNASCVDTGPEQPQNAETRGTFIHLFSSWRSVMSVVSSVPESGVGARAEGGGGSDIEVFERCGGSEEREAAV